MKFCRFITFDTEAIPIDFGKILHITFIITSAPARQTDGHTFANRHNRVENLKLAEVRNLGLTD